MDWATRIQTPSFENARQGLLDAVGAFQDWASEQPNHDPPGEWEADYDDWPALNTAVIKLLQASSPAQWDQSIVHALLYALARDNEREILKDDLVDSPSHLIALAKEGVNYDDPQARWQLADALGYPVFASEQAEPLLERFAYDHDEYVSRRALLALSRRRSPMAEQLAVRAWATGHEYQRIAAIHVLNECSSPLLSMHLKLAKSSPGEYLRARASELDAEHDETCELPLRGK